MPSRIWSPPSHWRLLALCLFVLLVMIAFQGFATHLIGAGTEPVATNESAPLMNARPILAARHGVLTPIAPPFGRRIALTFDDGPDPTWTPRIAAVLRADQVRATFFEIGSQVARYRDVVRRLVRDGNEIGNHTFTHVLLSSVPGWEQRMQIELTEATIAGITGHYARLIRPPYASLPDAITPSQDRALAHVAGGHYFMCWRTTTARTGDDPVSLGSLATQARRAQEAGS